MVSAINVNYRLTYLKETVMGYYLFQEDPTYIVINNVIQSNNYIIVSTLLNKHLTQFIQLL
jgi:protein phosphatase-4 regulatory subunit 3